MGLGASHVPPTPLERGVLPLTHIRAVGWRAKPHWQSGADAKRWNTPRHGVPARHPCADRVRIVCGSCRMGVVRGGVHSVVSGLIRVLSSAP